MIGIIELLFDGGVTITTLGTPVIVVPGMEKVGVDGISSIEQRHRTIKHRTNGRKQKKTVRQQHQRQTR